MTKRFRLFRNIESNLHIDIIDDVIEIECDYKSIDGFVTFKVTCKDEEYSYITSRVENVIEFSLL